MREIEFRAWCKKHKVMVYHIGSINWNEKNEVFVNQDYKCAGYEVLMQYTGLKDKSGKGIYEGDVVRITSMVPGGTDFKGRVEFEEGSWWVANSEDAVRLFTETDELEVTGNIYE